jgi:adenine-specific DNA-methyltransferase
MGKSYDYSYQISDFTRDHDRMAPLVERAIKPQRSICWQTGYHVRNNVTFPLDFAVHQSFSSKASLILRNRIIWHFGHGTHAARRFSGRHETILWYSKGNDYLFDLDAVRVPQRYPGKKYYKGPKKGQYSSNPLGKNPSDVWEIPNVNAGHVEKTAHPCQFPVALASRLVDALTVEGETVFDPFSGSASSGIAAVMSKRRFLGAELSREFCEIAEARYINLKDNKLKVRPIETPILEPAQAGSVGRLPEHFKLAVRDLMDG